MSETEIPGSLDLDFSRSPTVYSFLRSNAFVRGIMGPVGCVAPETEVITEFGPLPIWQIDRPMRVLSWNDHVGQFQLSWCGGSFPKGMDYLRQVSTRQGEFAASGHHRIFCADRSYRRLDNLKSGDEVFGVSPGLDPISFLDGISSPQDALHSTGKAVDYLAHYAASARQYGRRLLEVEGIDLAFAPSRSDAQISAFQFGLSAAAHMGDRLALLSTHIRRGLCAGLMQIGDYFALLSPLQLGAASQVAAGPYSHIGGLGQSHLRSAAKIDRRSITRRSLGYSRSTALASSSSISNRSILSVTCTKRKRSYWDMQVLDTHNYVTADGTIHHNSGKSYACCAEIMLRAIQQKASPRDGIKYSRFVIVRNSYPELRTTTIKTWQELFPENVWGQMRWSPPISHHIKLPTRGKAAGIDCEVIFLALDQPKDVRKLLSLELTGAWVNEARELPKAVIDGLTHRVGRYPTKRDGGATWRGVWMDTNPMDDDHWWYNLSEKDKQTGKYAWKFYKQPGGVEEVPAADLPEMPEANGYIQSAGKWWHVNPDAENLNNLPAGYYDQMLGGKNLDWIRCYAQGRFTYVQEGKPVWSEYDDHLMSGDVAFDPSLPIHVGLDFGLTPAAIFGQRHFDGQWRVLHELVMFDIGLERFGQMLIGDLQSRFPNVEWMIWGDPAGMKRDEIYEVTAFDYLKTLGLQARPTASNEWKVRREAGAAPMMRLVRGKPGLIVHSACKQLRKSLAGGYHFKRVAVGAGYERFKDMPNKNMSSHCGDAYGYLMLGGGEHRSLTRGGYTSRDGGKVHVANSEFDVFS